MSRFWKDTIKLVILALLIVVPFRLYIAQPFVVEGASMDPTFATGQYLIVDEISYYFKNPARGSILVFKYPKDRKKSFIKRVIGLPNEEILISEGLVTIINPQNPDGFVLEEPYLEFTKKDSFEYILGPDEYFVLGDNRLASSDSRVWGPVREEDIIGRPIIRFFPPALLPGDVTKFINEGTSLK